MTVTALFLLVFIISILIFGCTEFMVYTATLRTKNHAISDYADDTLVFKDPALNGLDITVETPKAQVPLNSTLKTQDDIEQAIEPVCNVRHVNSVASASTTLRTH